MILFHIIKNEEIFNGKWHFNILIGYAIKLKTVKENAQEQIKGSCDRSWNKITRVLSGNLDFSKMFLCYD